MFLKGRFWWQQKFLSSIAIPRPRFDWSWMPNGIARLPWCCDCLSWVCDTWSIPAAVLLLPQDHLIKLLDVTRHTSTPLLLTLARNLKCGFARWYYPFISHPQLLWPSSKNNSSTISFAQIYGNSRCFFI